MIRRSVRCSKREDSIDTRSVAIATLLLTGCAPLQNYAERPAPSSLGCIRAVVHELPADARASHCAAAGLIARYCSVTEAILASLGKELLDAFSAGDASWVDLREDARGIRCARSANSDSDVLNCCRLEH